MIPDTVFIFSEYICDHRNVKIQAGTEMAECLLSMQQAFGSFPRMFKYMPGILPPGEAGRSEIQDHSLGHLKVQKNLEYRRH